VSNSLPANSFGRVENVETRRQFRRLSVAPVLQRTRPADGIRLYPKVLSAVGRTRADNTFTAAGRESHDETSVYRRRRRRRRQSAADDRLRLRGCRRENRRPKNVERAVRIAYDGN